MKKEKEDDKDYEVELNIYNMEFWKNGGFTHDNIEFIPYGDYKEIYEKIKNEKIHYPTGKAKISLSADTHNKAIEKAEIILSDYGRLLTFAQDRDVFFRHYICYEIENGNRHEKRGLRSVVVGVDKTYGSSIIHPAGIEEFIKIAIPVVRNEAQFERPGIIRAINWFNVANKRHIKIVPTMFPIFWIVLEMLANAHAKANEKEFIISDDEFKIVGHKFEALIGNDLVLFSIPGELEEGLNKGIVPEGLNKKMVETEGISFSKNITITKEGEGKWVIIDEEKKNTYIVQKENGELNTYLTLNHKKRKTLERNVGGINRRPIGNKIESLLTSYKLGIYNSEIRELKKFRDNIIHGNVLSYDFNKNIDNERKLKRILEKLILSMLDFDDNKFVHSSIRRDRLLALQ
ncbi:MAG: hypothetical protein AEth_01279 [Candidatus Argoarchaeum ethanivorans]|uniref:Apea-like HEPN domain-containing protein n=1 Tax=Candidatus Argoarchaeum ethanivorans TaxID=2608793 RepID=A0A8B3S1V2_9EURY|nr:MAG: hypothetical protein AEth_01279 [Candidatus Argoarchaeum ethanivorans]